MDDPQNIMAWQRLDTNTTSSGKLTEPQFETFVKAFETGRNPVHVHCIANWRVSAFIYRYHRDRQGMPDTEARALLQQPWDPAAMSEDYARPWAAFIAEART